jgi:hypothetical protein
MEGNGSCREEPIDGEIFKEIYVLYLKVSVTI